MPHFQLMNIKSVNWTISFYSRLRKKKRASEKAREGRSERGKHRISQVSYKIDGWGNSITNCVVN